MDRLMGPSTGPLTARGPLSHQRSKRGASAANLKFLSVSPRVRYRNFKFEAALENNRLLELL